MNQSQTNKQALLEFSEEESSNLDKLIQLISQKDENNFDVVKNEIAEGMAECKLVYTEDGIPYDYEFLSINKAFEQHTGLEQSFVTNKTVLEIYPNTEKIWIDFYLKVALSQKSNTKTQFCENTQRHFISSATSSKNGEFTMLFKHITKQEAKTIGIKKRERLLENNENLRDKLLAEFSHEARSPINAILGFSDLLNDDALTTTERKTYVDYIKASSHKLLKIVSNIVDDAKAEKHEAKLTPNNCDLNKLLTKLCKNYKSLNTNKDLKIKVVKTLSDRESNIITDITKLAQILTRLLEITLQNTEKGKVEFGYTLQDKFLQFYVKNTGAVLNKEIEESNPNNILDFLVSKKLISFFEGEIWKEEASKKETGFYFTIPYNPVTIEKFKEKKHTILIAEDDDINFLLLNLWLSDLFTIVRAKNGSQAVQLFIKKPSIDLVIMDIRMPYMDGIEATREIRKIDIHVPIIAHTAYAMDEGSIRIRQAGCNQVLIKPILRDTLLRVLAKYKIKG